MLCRFDASGRRYGRPMQPRVLHPSAPAASVLAWCRGQYGTPLRPRRAWDYLPSWVQTQIKLCELNPIMAAWLPISYAFSFVWHVLERTPWGYPRDLEGIHPRPTTWYGQGFYVIGLPTACWIGVVQGMGALFPDILGIGPEIY